MTAPADDRALAAVTLLRSDEARALLRSWPLADLGDRHDTRVLLSWSRVADVPYHVVARLAPMLFAHEFCRADRTVDPEALRVCRHIEAQRLAGAAGGAGRGGKTRRT